MKKLLFTFSLLGAVLGASGQGLIFSQNNAATAITNTLTGARAVTSTRVGFYGNPNAAATAGSPGWVMAGGSTNLVSPGIFFGGTRTYAGFLAGTPAAFQVRAWLTTGSFPDYDTALLGEPGGAFGQSVVMQITPSAPGPSPAPTFLGSGFQSFNIGIPEPSSIALGLLGLGAIALFRRRK